MTLPIHSECDLAAHSAENALPFRDAFAAPFFVSVDMLFDPSSLLTTPGQVAAVLSIILLAKPLAALLIVLALRYPLRTGLTVAAGLAQIGEFSFILAELGRGLAAAHLGKRRPAAVRSDRRVARSSVAGDGRPALTANLC